MTHYLTPVVFRVTKHGEWKGTLDAAYANANSEGLELVSGDSYSNDWYLSDTRLAKPEEYAEELERMNGFTLGEDTWEFIPVKKRNFNA